MNIDNLFTESGNSASTNGTNSVKGELINIQNLEDAYARYKMPKLESRIKDKGKFAETFVSNLVDVAKSLKVKLPAPLKFIESNLGSQFMLADKKDPSSYYIKGRFSYEQLYEPLRAFIDQYVLCTKCGLPELEYKKDKDKYYQSCKSCGNSVKIDPKDRIYKLLL
jgi:translation initiation factor 2 beta subunit (eIF-2beta)/eIF-5